MAGANLHTFRSRERESCTQNALLDNLKRIQDSLQREEMLRFPEGSALRLEKNCTRRSELTWNLESIGPRLPLVYIAEYKPANRLPVREIDVCCVHTLTLPERELTDSRTLQSSTMTLGS